MTDLLDQIRLALNYRLHYLALFASLSLPAICAALESENGWSTQKKYKAWFDKHVSSQYEAGGETVSRFTGEDVWRLRCGFVHEGSLQHPTESYTRLIFAETDERQYGLHNNIFESRDYRILNLNVDSFCLGIIRGVEEWLPSQRDSEPFETNYARFVKRYPKGFPPIPGIPIIA